MQLLGSVKRMCDACKENKEVKLFEDNGEHRKLCNNCIFEQYGLGKPDNHKIIDSSFCKICGKITDKTNKCEECK